MRNHGRVPSPDPDAFRLRVGGLVELELELDLAELRERFPAREVVATLQCAGNRRAGLMAVRDIPGEAAWGPAATGTAAWRGAALSDVLAAAGVRAEAAHVGFAGADTSEEPDPPERYGGSIPLRKALSEEVLLAWEMNGEPLHPEHGAPLRAVVPGYVGARSVKWLDRVEVRAEPWDGHYQAVAYRLLAPGTEPGRGVGMALGELPLSADVLVPDDDARVPAGTLEVLGYALAGGNATSHALTCRPTAGPTFARPSSWRTRAAGRGECGERRSSSSRGSTSSWCALGTAPAPPSPSMPRRSGTPRAT